MVLRIEVYPSKYTYKEDYQRMIADVSEMVYAAAIDFMQKTYQEFSIGDKQNNVPAIFFQIISMIFEKYMNAAKRITTVPHHKLITERTVVPEYKAKRTDTKIGKMAYDSSEKYSNGSRWGFGCKSCTGFTKTDYL